LLQTSTTAGWNPPLAAGGRECDESEEVRHGEIIIAYYRHRRSVTMVCGELNIKINNWSS
jgi:hypothetical protein